VRRRQFIGLIGGAALGWPLAARGQSSALPVIGFLSSRTAKEAEYLVASFREGLKQAGCSEGVNVAIEYRYAEDRYDRLPSLAQNLVSRQVAVIIAGGTSRPAIAATKTIPIVFTTGYDPVAAGLVKSLNKPEGNITGATFYSGALAAKQMEILIELAPKATTFGLLVNPESTGAPTIVRDAQSGAQAIGRMLRVFNASSEVEIAAAFAALAKIPNSALLVAVDPFFDSRPAKLVGLAARNAIPVVYYLPEFARLGGLISYGASITDTYRQAGNYACRIAEGETPANLPVQLPTKFDLVINVKTAKVLDLKVPPTLLATANEVIE
jgi:putative tryptophan/tyrosine transport system substrate-binding protein